MVAGGILLSPGALAWPAFVVHVLLPAAFAASGPGGWHVTVISDYVVPWPLDWVPWGFALLSALGVAAVAGGAWVLGTADDPLYFALGAVRATTGVGLLSGGTLIEILGADLLRVMGGNQLALGYDVDAWVWGVLGTFAIAHGALLMTAGRGPGWRAAALIVGLTSIPTGWVLAAMFLRGERR
jgi:hypothetical protein